MIRVAADTAVIRATVSDDDRSVLIEAELSRVGRNRVQVNRQKLGRARDLLGVVRVSVFAPDDLVIVKGAPSERRRFLDDTLVALATKYDAARLELDRIVRQRNVLLKQAGGRADRRAGDVARRVGRAAGGCRRSVRSRPGDARGAVPTDGDRGLRRPRRRELPGGARVRAGMAAHRVVGGAATARERRRPPRRLDRRPPSRRPGDHARRDAGANARLAGRAAHTGARAAARRPSARRRAHRVDTGARARRRAVRARPRAWRPHCSPTCRPGRW